MKEKHKQPKEPNPLKHPTARPRKDAARYLGRTVADWTKMLHSKDGLERRLAVYALGELGPAARSALPDLQEALKDEESYVRVWAASALCKVDPKNEEASAVLLECMNDPVNFVRSLAAWHTGRNCTCLPELEKCLPELEKLLEDDDQSVRTEAGIALRKIEGKVGSPPELEVLALEQDPHGNEALNQDEDETA